MTTTITSSRATSQAAYLMDSETKHRLFTAAELARLHYPGAVGELLHQELLSWMVFGHHLGSTLIMRVADQVITAPAPDNSRR